MANVNFSSENYSSRASINSWMPNSYYLFQTNAISNTPNSTGNNPSEPSKVSLVVDTAGIAILDEPILFRDPVEEEEAKDFRSGLISSLENDIFEPDRKSLTERYVEQWLARKPAMAQIVIMNLFLESRDNDKRMIGMLNLLAHLDVKRFHPANEMIALGALSHKSNEVKEYALRAFEYWEDVDLAGRLKSHELTPKWIDDYRRTIISEICGDL